MLKENIQTFIYSLFFGIMIVYAFNTPPKVIIKHKNLNELNNVNYIESDETCPNDL
jgi:hypothetical protein